MAITQSRIIALVQAARAWERAFKQTKDHVLASPHGEEFAQIYLLTQPEFEIIECVGLEERHFQCHGRSNEKNRTKMARLRAKAQASEGLAKAKPKAKPKPKPPSQEIVWEVEPEQAQAPEQEQAPTPEQANFPQIQEPAFDLAQTPTPESEHPDRLPISTVEKLLEKARREGKL
jgi:hypothetical protein